jgi:hypothetical protein
MRRRDPGRWVLLISIIAVLVALPLLHKLLHTLPAYRQYDMMLRDKDIDPTTLFYSEDQHTYTAARWLRSRIGNRGTESRSEASVQQP